MTRTVSSPVKPLPGTGLTGSTTGAWISTLRASRRSSGYITGKIEEQWTGDYIFENEWQSFRTKKDRSLEPKSVAHKCSPGRRKIAVKVVDIFGNDTMTIVEVSV